MNKMTPQTASKTHESPRPARDAIQTLIQWAMAHETIHAVLLTSTRAIPEAAMNLSLEEQAAAKKRGQALDFSGAIVRLLDSISTPQ
jgi:hypothetical protein